MSLKASISGIRGIIGDSLTPQVIIDYVSAFSSIIKEGSILLGRDSRPSGNIITELVKATLNMCGRDVVDIGIVPTPVVLFGVANGNYAGGIIITASHNPIEWNALKLVNEKGKFISPKEFELLTFSYNQKNFKFCTYNNLGNNKINNKIPEAHIEKLINFIDKNAIKKAKLKVVLDAVNGAGGPLAILLLQKLGCNVIPINTDPTGIFAHPPEPKPENLTQLNEVVKNNKADIGFALDPDADRLVVASNTGEVLSEELTLAFCVKHYLSNYKKSDIVINLSTSRVIEDIATEHGVKIYRVPTGEINVTEKMEEINSSLGGEGNGGIIAADLNKCRDSFVGMILILEMIAKSKQNIMETTNKLPKYYLIKQKISSENIDFQVVKEKILLEFKDKRIDIQDGIRIDFEDEWVLFRKSNTEPIIRIFAESKSEENANKLVQKMMDLLNN